ELDFVALGGEEQLVGVVVACGQVSDLAPGRQASIGGDRGLSLTLHMHEDGWLSVTVEDPDRLTTLLGIRPEENWVHEHQERLQRVRHAWPSEVITTAPGAYEWSRKP
ncbi:DUF5959 family protein, partial [Streptomyces sp. NPDC056159]|uniref:DUF5959 family protein n=1 Tax=Streptomyces sp. NPDC056159 TaxID=3155537 RepID=UPI003445AE9C